MNKIDKFLKKLSPEKRSQFISLLDKIVRGELSGLDIKKLKGTEYLFRIRKGDVRIILSMFDKQNPVVLDISYRSEKTYR
jgi:mRNA-degrading endonuclease RelE of RelBE toxin-antitoxin system